MSRITAIGLALPEVVGTDVSSIPVASPAWAEVTLFEPGVESFDKAAEVPEFSLKDLGVSVKSYLDRSTSLALAAAALALSGQRLPRMGLSFASRWGCLSSMRLFYAKVRENPRLAPPLPFSHSYVNSPAAVLAIEFALDGFHAVYSHGKGCALSALISAAQEAQKSATPVLVVAADALGPERFALYARTGRLGEPSREAPGVFVPSEGAVALLVEPVAAGARISAWARPGTSGAQNLEHALAGTIHDVPRLVYTDAATLETANWYEQSLEGGGPSCPERRFLHLGLTLGEAEAALPLAACAYATRASEAVLVVAGGPSEPTAVVISQGDVR